MNRTLDSDQEFREHACPTPASDYAINRGLVLAAIIVSMLCLGTLGYCWLEGWSYSDAFYMTVITISTVGYTEINELSPTGRAFTSGLILVSIVCMAYWTASITSVLIEGDLSGAFRDRRMKRMAEKKKNHVIVCGSGIYALSIIETLYRKNQSLVVVTDRLQQADVIVQRYPSVPVIKLSPTDEVALAQAGLTKASCVVAATDACIDNLLVSMTCKQLNPRLVVYSFSLDVKLASRMLKVGVDQVICPHVLGGAKIAELVQEKQAALLKKQSLKDSFENPANQTIPQNTSPYDWINRMRLDRDEENLDAASFQVPHMGESSTE